MSQNTTAEYPSAMTSHEAALEFAHDLKIPTRFAALIVDSMERDHDKPKRRWSREERFIFNYLFSEPHVRRNLEKVAGVVIPEFFGREGVL